jgi:hypothetical protein
MKNKIHKPTAGKFTLLRQLCNFIPPHLVPCLARQTGVEDHARTFSPAIQITLPGGDFETDVEQLPEARIESFAFGVMAQPIRVCSRLDLFQTGTMLTPRFAAMIQVIART